MLWTIIGHYSLGVAAVVGLVLIFVFATALSAQASAIPLVGPWVARNINHIRDWALVAAVIIGGAIIIYGIGVHDGKALVQAKWDKAEQAAVEQGTQARAGAERSVGKRPAASSMRNDPYNRDH